MHGDFSRFPYFDPHDTRVLLQQARPITDADWNTQAAILLQLQRDFLKGYFGWHGTLDENVFSDVTTPTQMGVEVAFCLNGDYYVDGLRCRFSISSNEARNKSRRDDSGFNRGFISVTPLQAFPGSLSKTLQILRAKCVTPFLQTKR